MNFFGKKHKNARGKRKALTIALRRVSQSVQFRISESVKRYYPDVLRVVIHVCRSVRAEERPGGVLQDFCPRAQKLIITHS